VTPRLGGAVKYMPAPVESTGIVSLGPRMGAGRTGARAYVASSSAGAATDRGGMATRSGHVAVMLPGIVGAAVGETIGRAVGAGVEARVRPFGRPGSAFTSVEGAAGGPRVVAVVDGGALGADAAPAVGLALVSIAATAAPPEQSTVRSLPQPSSMATRTAGPICFIVVASERVAHRGHFPRSG
jgi:uncharacterized membrane protein YeaQ/YmgE (transglycosylase-associated protein family)